MLSELRLGLIAESQAHLEVLGGFQGLFWKTGKELAEKLTVYIRSRFADVFEALTLMLVPRWGKDTVLKRIQFAVSSMSRKLKSFCECPPFLRLYISDELIPYLKQAKKQLEEI